MNSSSAFGSQGNSLRASGEESKQQPTAPSRQETRKEQALQFQSTKSQLEKMASKFEEFSASDLSDAQQSIRMTQNYDAPRGRGRGEYRGRGQGRGEYRGRGRGEYRGRGMWERGGFEIHPSRGGGRGDFRGRGDRGRGNFGERGSARGDFGGRGGYRGRGRGRGSSFGLGFEPEEADVSQSVQEPGADKSAWLKQKQTEFFDAKKYLELALIFFQPELDLKLISYAIEATHPNPELAAEIAKKDPREQVPGLTPGMGSLKMLRDLLKLYKRVESDKDSRITLAKLFLDNNFLGEETLGHYRDFIAIKCHAGKFKSHELSQIIQDLGRWVSILVLQAKRFPSRIAVIPAAEISLFSENFEEQVQTHSALAFSGSELELQSNYINLKEQAELLVKLKASVQEKRGPAKAEGTEAKEENKVAYNSPNDFRSLPVNPTLDDLTQNAPFLSPIVLKKGFESLEHYLDVNFRLLKEDFCGELRDGFRELKQADLSKKNQHLNFYSDVTCNGVFASTLGIFGLELTVHLSKNFKLASRGKFMYGQLVILSADNFEKSVYIGVIREADRMGMSKELAERGSLTLKIELVANEVVNLGTDDLDHQNQRRKRKPSQTSLTDAYNDLREKRLTMIESKVYFEAYSHVLKSLQTIREIPLRDQIVFTNFENQHRPDRWRDAAVISDIKKIAMKTKLDETQFKAFRRAFRRPLSLIQGPPGTGKTFVGAHIVEAILKTQERSHGLDCGPILLTCLTNHALDQFLEHCLEFTKKVIRIGGRGKDSLKAYSIQNYAQTHGFKLPKDYYADLEDLTKSVSVYNTLNMKRVRASLCPLPSIKQIEEYSSSTADVLEMAKLEYDSVMIKIYKKSPENFLRDVYNPMAEVFGSPYLLYWLGAFDPEAMLEAFQVEGSVMLDSKAASSKTDQVEEEDYVGLEQEMDSYVEKLEGVGSSSELRARQEDVCSMSLMTSNNYKKAFEKKGIKTYGDLFKAIRETHHQEPIDLLKSSAPPSLEEKLQILKGSSQTKVDDELATMRRLEGNIKELYKLTEESKARSTVQVLQQADIIAMTTTGAAKYKSFIQNLNSEIMLIEEAAEIHEAHITSAMPRRLQQLILIGDHKQLRPAVNSMRLASKFNLDISMFERLIMGGIEHVTLNTQRRMRPEISSVIRTLYPALEDHKNVEKYPSIRGVGCNYFFFNHQFPEQVNKELSKTSKVNPREAEMVLRFAFYLFQQGYEPSKITILSLYVGQLLHLKMLMKKDQRFLQIKNVNVQTVDNFQGEENDIVILSFVRSNPANTIGFLKISNRVNVALSRARWGLFIFGNARCLRDGVLRLQEKHQKDMGSASDTGDMTGDIWLQVLRILNERKSIIDRLEISCPTHMKHLEIVTPEDFMSKTPEGGCDEVCGIRMECGHACRAQCHPMEKTEADPIGHNKIVCFQPCSRPTECGHPCAYKCHLCKDGHQPCTTQVQETLERCGHTLRTSCANLRAKKKGGEIKCEAPCEKIFPCGHQCQKLCFADCNAHIKKGYTSNCKQRVLKKLSCGHEEEVDCGQPRELYESIDGCSKYCEAALECGHQCTNRCGTCKDQLFHGDCYEKCGRIQFCNHECRDYCSSSNCSPCQKACTISCSHSRCNQNCGQVCPPCREPCEQACIHSKCSRYCFEECDRPPCSKPCKAMLKCGHPCIGFCGETCPTVCRIESCEQYDSTVFEVLFGNEDKPDARFVLLEDCGHSIEADALTYFVETQGSSSSSIKYPECPKCKTQIQNCHRLGNQIKRVTAKVNKVKSKVLSGVADLMKQILLLNIKLPNLPVQSPLTYSLCELFKSLLKRKENLIANVSSTTPFQMNTLLFQMQLAQKVRNALNYSNSPQGPYASCGQEFAQKNNKVWNRTLDQVMTQLKKLEVSNDRLSVISDIAYLLENQWILLSVWNQKEYSDRAKEVISLTLEKKFILPKEKMEEAKTLVRELKENMELATEEKELIIKAVGLSRGHWYECPNGHPYAIGECGGAMVKSKCPECGASIGGGSHQLDPSNRQATSFAGQARPAWDPDNYNLNLEAAQRLDHQLNL